MNYRLFNYASGVTSVTIYPVRAHAQAVAQAECLAAERAQAEQIPVADALRRYFAERRAGQIAYLIVSVTMLLLTAALVHRAPEWLLCLLALGPGAFFLLVQGYTYWASKSGPHAPGGT